MKPIEERAKNICISAFCCLCPKRVYTNCIWRYNTERANSQCHITEYKEPINQVYEEAVDELKAQREELTRWHNPFLKGMTTKNVIVKYIAVGDPANPYYTIGRREPSGVWDCECELATSAPRFEIIGWREIHENE